RSAFACAGVPAGRRDTSGTDDPCTPRSSRKARYAGVMSGTVLVVNPRSAGGKTERAWPRLAETIREAYGDFDARMTAGPGGADPVRYFTNIASFGISGLVDRYVNRSSKALGGKLSFAFATVRAGLAYKNAEVRLTLDGAPAKEGRIYNVAVANGRYFGGGMK